MVLLLSPLFFFGDQSVHHVGANLDAAPGGVGCICVGSQQVIRSYSWDSQRDLQCTIIRVHRCDFVGMWICFALFVFATLWTEVFIATVVHMKAANGGSGKICS